MLSSLPPIIPHDSHNLWSPAPSSIASRPSAIPTGRGTSRSEQQSRRAAVQRDGGQTTQQKSALDLVRADEELLSYRKSNIRRFGATWLRPPGVPKTYQAMIDEAMERAEQEALARREAQIQEAQAAAEEDARQQMAMEVDSGGVIAAGEGMERDLDDEVPEAEEDEDDENEDEDEDEDDEEDEESEDEAAEQQERDLDNSIPEAGSYQHTDTEVEDTTSDEEDEGSPRPAIARQPPHNPFPAPSFNPATTAARLRREMYDRDNRRHSARANDNVNCPIPDPFASQPYLSDSEASDQDSNLAAALRSQRVMFVDPPQLQQQQSSQAQHLFTPENNPTISTHASPRPLGNPPAAQDIRPAVQEDRPRPPPMPIPANMAPPHHQQSQAYQQPPRRPAPPPQPQFRHPSGSQQLNFNNPAMARSIAVGGYGYGYGDATAEDREGPFFGRGGQGETDAGSSPLGGVGPSGASTGARGGGGPAAGGRGRGRGGRAAGRGV